MTRIHSVAGLHGGAGLVAQRPFRAPHHTISASGLVGGGGAARAGGGELAHHGVLFLDELSEFTAPSLEALRQPLEDGRVAIVRGQRVIVFPTRCHAGRGDQPLSLRAGEPGCSLLRRPTWPAIAGASAARCWTASTCRSRSARRPPRDAPRRPRRTSAGARSRVLAARERQLARLAGSGLTCNGQMTPRVAAGARPTRRGARAGSQRPTTAAP